MSVGESTLKTTTLGGDRIFYFGLKSTFHLHISPFSCLILWIETGSGGVCCHNERGRVGNRKSNPEGVSPRDLTYCTHKPECIVTTNPDRLGL